MTATEVMPVRLYTGVSRALLVLFALEEDDEKEAGDYLVLAGLFLWRLEEIQRDRAALPPYSVRGIDPTIACLSEQEAWINLRFRKPDLLRLLKARFHKKKKPTFTPAHPKTNLSFPYF